MKKTEERVHLFWVVTPDHKEDWFIFACDKRSAERYHEGYSRGDAIPTLIIADVSFDESSPSALPRPAQLDDLKCLGFEIIDASPIRVVRLDNVLFIEGGLKSLIDQSRCCQSEVADSVHKIDTHGELSAAL
jgi:hypothetical protein